MPVWLRAAAMVLVASATAYAAPDPTGGVLVQPDGTECLDTRDSGAIPLVLSHRAEERTAFPLAVAAGPPYRLHPYSFSIEFVSPTQYEKVTTVLEHFRQPDQDVTFETGDRLPVLAYATQWPLPGYAGKVRARVRDGAGRWHSSEELSVCPPRHGQSGRA
ncbi:hypothetical protein EGJ34_17025 [Stenotrophomonas sp. 278]|nr:hypothetical protein EGJ34_17025 [Stenotrophomonas sp. 278]